MSAHDYEGTCSECQQPIWGDTDLNRHDEPQIFWHHLMEFTDKDHDADPSDETQDRVNKTSFISAFGNLMGYR